MALSEVIEANFGLTLTPSVRCILSRPRLRPSKAGLNGLAGRRAHVGGDLQLLQHFLSRHDKTIDLGRSHRNTRAAARASNEEM